MEAGRDREAPGWPQAQLSPEPRPSLLRRLVTSRPCQLESQAGRGQDVGLGQGKGIGQC